MADLLFEPITIGTLHLRNRLMRSATAEFLADPQTGIPLPKLATLYRALAEGGVGLIVTGHTCVAYSGRTSAHMTAIVSDEFIEPWREVIAPAQEAGARVMIQINHGGAQVDPSVVPEPLSPSGVRTNMQAVPRPLEEEEIWEIIEAFGQAARRAREAGFDGVQIHSAHGYLISQFLSPGTNQRADRWGGDLERRFTFLREVIRAVRAQVGEDFAVWTKLGVAGKAQSGLTVEQGAKIAAWCAQEGLDCIEISHAWGIPEEIDQTGEAWFLPLAQEVRRAVGDEYPLALVGGFSTKAKMEEVLQSGVVQIISLSRPLIAEPDLAAKFARGQSDKAICIRCDQCRPSEFGQGIGCYHPTIRELLGKA